MADKQSPSITTSGEGSPQETPVSPTKTKRYSLRSMISLSLFLFFVLLLITGLALYISPRGRVANWVQWTLLGLTKDQWTSIHTNASVLFVILSIFHLYYNWKVFWNYLSSKLSSGIHRGRELATAAILVLLVIVGCVWELPPFQNVMVLNEKIKNYWEAKSEHAPVPHAEELKMGLFAQQIGVAPQQIRKVLVEAGYEPKPGMTLKEIAEQKDAAPKELLDLINEKIPESERTENPMRLGPKHGSDGGNSERGGQGGGRRGRSNGDASSETGEPSPEDT